MKPLKFWLSGIVFSGLLFSSVGLAADKPLFRYEGLDFTAAELAPELRNRLFEAELEYYQQIKKVLDQAILDLHLEDEAERRQLSKIEVMQNLLPVEPPTDAELKAFYEDNKERIRGKFEQVKQRLSSFLMNQRRQVLQARLVAKLAAENKFELLLSQPLPPQFEIDIADYPSKGPQDAPITIVEYADYRCPHCIKAHPVVSQVMAKYPEKVRLVFMDLPVIRRGGVSRLVAEGGVCADLMGKFWQYHDLAFGQSQLNLDSPLNLAKQLGLDVGAFETCLQSADTKAEIAKSEAQAARLGVNATPTFFINGKRLLTDDLERGLTRAIEAELNGGV